MIILTKGFIISIAEAFFYLPKNITNATQDNFKADAHCVFPECNKMDILVADNKTYRKIGIKNAFEIYFSVSVI